MSALDKVREIIRTEVARANPIANSRIPLELIVEPLIRYEETEGQLVITVVDESGDPRPGCTIQDVIADLQSKHPMLFRVNAPVASTATPANVKLEPSRYALAVNSLTHTSEVGEARPTARVVAGKPIRSLDPVPASGDQQPTEDEPTASVPKTASPLISGKILQVAFPLRHAGPDQNTRGEGPALREKGLSQPAARHPPALTGSTSRLRRRSLTVVSAGILILAVGGMLLYLVSPHVEIVSSVNSTASSSQSLEPRTLAHRSVSEAQTTQLGAPISVPLPSTAAQPVPLPEGTLRGTPEVLDTATLWLAGKAVSLFGVQWTHGAGEPVYLVQYLRGREITCLPTSTGQAYRCQVEGRDLSTVVLFNGGGRATADATPELLAAEAHARSVKVGLWSKSSL